jgi:hypothetical protein
LESPCRSRVTNILKVLLGEADVLAQPPMWDCFAPRAFVQPAWAQAKAFGGLFYRKEKLTYHDGLRHDSSVLVGLIAGHWKFSCEKFQFVLVDAGATGEYPWRDMRSALFYHGF